MAKRIAWLAADVVAGLVLAGVLAPIVLALAPTQLRGAGLMAAVCLVSIAAAGVLRRFAVGTSHRG